nr:hypothetical protein [Tanacetum cinerariifolium]
KFEILFYLCLLRFTIMKRDNGKEPTTYPNTMMAKLLTDRPSAIPGRAPEELFVPAIIPISVRELLELGRAPFFPFPSPTFNPIHPPPPDI